jgi:hypothetical protein
MRPRRKKHLEVSRTLFTVYKMIVSLEPMPEDDPRHPNGHAMRRFKVAEAFVKLALDVRREEIINDHKAIVREGT